MDEEHLLKEKYKKIDDKFYPMLNVKIDTHKKEISVLADTGCDGGIVLLKSQINSINLGDKINEDPLKVYVADGHILGADLYASKITVNDDEKEITICVIDNENLLGEEGPDATIILGREYLDKFKVIFDGISQEFIIYK